MTDDTSATMVDTAKDKAHGEALGSTDATAPVPSVPEASPFTLPGYFSTAKTELAPAASVAPAAVPVAHRRLLHSVLTACKWTILLGLLALVASIPAAGAGKPDFWLWMIPASATLAACCGTFLPRLLLPRLFGRWFDPTQAGRDWLIVGILTAILYTLLFATLGRLGPLTAPAEDLQRWAWSRLPLLIAASAAAIVMATRLPVVCQSALVPWSRKGASIVLLTVYAVATGTCYLHVQSGLYALACHGYTPMVARAGSVLCVVGLAGLACLALVTRTRAGGRSLPLEEVVTVIGGKGVGKTMFLTMAYHDLATRVWGRIMVRGTEVGEGYCEGIYHTMKKSRTWPNESLMLNDLPFRLRVGLDDVARFSWNDYPGGVISDPYNPSMREPRERFFERAHNSTALLVLVDAQRLMEDDTRLLALYADVMAGLLQGYRDKLAMRDIPPVCVALTKCDLLTDAEQDSVFRMHVRPFVRILEQLCREAGDPSPRVVSFFTSAIVGATRVDGEMRFPPHPFPLGSVRCAEVILWIVSQALRKDYGLQESLTEFVGASVLGNAVVELEMASGA